MTLDTRALLGAAILLVALLCLRGELAPGFKAAVPVLCWCLRKLAWLWLVLCLLALLVLAAFVVGVLECFSVLAGIAQDRRIALVARRKAL